MAVFINDLTLKYTSRDSTEATRCTHTLPAQLKSSQVKNMCQVADEVSFASIYHVFGYDGKRANGCAGYSQHWVGAAHGKGDCAGPTYKYVIRTVGAIPAFGRDHFHPDFIGCLACTRDLAGDFHFPSGSRTPSGLDNYDDQYRA